MTDEIRVDPEGAIIEHALIAYFDSPFQAEEKSKERTRLVRNLINLRDTQNIRGALFDYELSDPDEYFRFGSDHVPPAGRHVFMCSVQDNRLVIKRHDVKFDAEAFFFGEGNAAGRCSAQLKIIVSGTKRDPPLSSRENPARMSVLPQADLGAGNPQ